MQTTDIISSMSGFTADFFGALETTFTDNSLNNSNCDLSKSNANKSLIIRQLKQDSALKISELLQKMIKSIIFEQIFIFGIKKKRKQERTPLNIHKHFYKIQLLFNLKNRAKQQWSFHRMNKFTQQFDMRQIIPSETQSETQIQPQTVITVQNNKIQYGQVTKIQTASSKIQKKVVIKQLNKNQEKSAKANLLIQALLKIFGYRRKLQQSFYEIKEYEYYLTKKCYLAEMLHFYAKSQMRNAFVKIANLQMQKNFKKEKAVIKIFEEQKDSTPVSKPTEGEKKVFENNYGLEEKIKFKKAGKVAKSSILIEDVETKSNASSKQKSLKKRPTSGLKFNRIIKKKSQSPQKKEKEEQRQMKNIELINLEQTKLKRQPSSFISHSAKIIKKAVGKSLKNQQSLYSDTYISKSTNFKQINPFKKLYYLSPQQLRNQVPDIHDQNFQYNNLPTTSDPKLTQSKMLNRQQSLTFSKKLLRLDDKKPLQFSNKKQKSRLSSNKSKSRKSLMKSDQQQPQTVNMQSLKSYYFPEQSQFGKAALNTRQKIKSTKYIGSQKWQGKSKKKRVCTENQIRNVKSSEKSPYLNQLKEKISRKPSERVISLNKMIERSISGRSNSKNSKTSRQEQKKIQNDEKLMISAQQYKIMTTRNASPQNKLYSQSSKTPPAQVPKQWCFTTKNPSTLASPLRSNQNQPLKGLLQFQKASANNRKT